MGQITIIHCGPKSKKRSDEQSVKTGAVRIGGVQWFDGTTISCPEQTPRFLLYECPGIPKITAGRGILVLTTALFILRTEAIPFQMGSCRFWTGENKEAARALRGTGKIAVTCSASARGTLSIASLDYERAAVSLQRDLRTLDGSVAEPMEMIVGLSQETPAYPLMAACGILLLSGIEGSYYF